VPANPKIRQNFEGFNPYAGKAMELDDNADVYATLAIAFELSQLRYMLSQVGVDRSGGGE
jgi:hypothetical protein